ncbi:hypothetical protein BGZ96_001733 [Linnemannia gamsii]|uniref:Arm-like repeat domain-containing protein n=1 Tax=Linnemannia gamsii TaxID=64522 RepID=A0ABQ7KG66_9FUNG|nr:hypothetical protein BGZ96_001733 [Linnemannia gamsii]
MSKESHLNPSGPPIHDTQSIATIRSTTSQSSTDSAFVNICKSSKKATEPYSTAKDRSISHGIAAVLVGGNLLPTDRPRENVGDDANTKSVSSKHMRKRNKFFGIFKSSNSGPKVEQPQNTSPRAKLHHLSNVSTQFSVEIEHTVSSTAVKSTVSSVQTSAPSNTFRLDVFPQNVHAPIVRISPPEFGTRIATTSQLAICIGLLPKEGGAVEQHVDPPQETSSDDDAQLAWLMAIKQDSTEQDRLRWLGTRMVDEFAKDVSKDSTEMAEMVLLGPVLDNEHFRGLLSCTITAFDQSVVLDVDLLQGLVQLVQVASPESLISDDLVKILRVLRLRLQDTHKQSSVHPYHLTLGVSRLLDVMAEHKVSDLNRVEDHEPLSGVLSGLKDSLDPYLMYQACYAFQALQYVPDDESPLQAILRHSVGVLDGLVKVSAAFKLDVGAVLEGLSKLQEALGGVVGVVGDVYEGILTLVESGRGVIDGFKEGLPAGKKRLWYAAIRAAQNFIQSGQLKDFNQLIYDAPYRRDPLFQWGICQLLGEIATDNTWDSTIRQQAVDLLGDLYKNDPEWGQDKSVKAWTLSIIGQLSTVTDQSVSTSAVKLLNGLNQDQGTNTGLPYPLRNRLPVPLSSPILVRVLEIPDVEYDLHNLKLQRLMEHRQGVYISPQAKPSLQSADEVLFPLMEKVQEFLSSQRQVFLVLGDSGSGKSTFNLELEHTLWKNYKKYGPIPLFINLPTINDPDHDLIKKQLLRHDFSEDQIREMKRHRHFVVICDGYDESQLMTNLHTTNQFNQTGQWQAKVVISCRSQYLGKDYRSRFHPKPVDPYQRIATYLFQEAVIAAFSKAQFSSMSTKYMDKLVNIPNLMDLVSNPFLLTLALEALPAFVASKKNLSAIKITRVQLYESFVTRWLESNQERLERSALTTNERSEFDMLLQDDFVYHGIKFQKDLATAIFIDHSGNPVVQYTHLRDKNTWKVAFFSPEGQTKLLLDSSTVTRSGSFFRFLHRSLLEYFYSRTIYDPLGHDAETDDGINIVKEPSILQFLAERVEVDALFKGQLLDVVDKSKSNAGVAQAAANAISILVRADVPFNDKDLRGIRSPGADLRGGQFDSADLEGADLSDVNMCRTWLRQANFSKSQMKGVQFGELPCLDVDLLATNCAFSFDGKLLAVAVMPESVIIYDTDTWKATVEYSGGPILAFSPISNELAVGRGWDTKDYNVYL